MLIFRERFKTNREYGCDMMLFASSSGLRATSRKLDARSQPGLSFSYIISHKVPTKSRWPFTKRLAICVVNNESTNENKIAFDLRESLSTFRFRLIDRQI